MDDADDIMSELGEKLRGDCFNASHLLAKLAQVYSEGNPWPKVKPLNDVVEHLVTELWDWNFSQTEIREAFEIALTRMKHYTAGQEKRS